MKIKKLKTLGKKKVNPFPYSPPGYFKELARNYLIFFSIQGFSNSGSKIPHKSWF